MQFKPVERKQSKTKMTLFGPPGSGKTLTALKLMRGLVGPEGKIVVIETERLGEEVARSSTYAYMGHLVGLMEPPFRPQKFIDALADAVRSGADGVIIDSLTDEWSGPGGYVDWRNELNDSYSKTTKPVHAELMQQIELFPVHLIMTMRAEPRAMFEQKPDGTNGRIVRMAEQVVGAKDVGYHVLLEMAMQDADIMKVVNSRYEAELPVGMAFNVKTTEFLDVLKAALSMGTPLPPTKNGWMIELAHLGFDTTEKQVALSKDLPALGKWSVERHEEMLHLVREFVTKG